MRLKLVTAAARLDRFCAELNSGLAAVALVLALTVSVTVAVRAEQALWTLQYAAAFTDPEAVLLPPSD